MASGSLTRDLSEYYMIVPDVELGTVAPEDIWLPIPRSCRLVRSIVVPKDLLNATPYAQTFEIGGRELQTNGAASQHNVTASLAVGSCSLFDHNQGDHNSEMAEVEDGDLLGDAIGGVLEMISDGTGNPSDFATVLFVFKRS